MRGLGNKDLDKIFMEEYLMQADQLTDSRQQDKVWHSMKDIVGIVFFGVLAGNDEWTDIADFAVDEREILGQYRKTKHNHAEILICLVAGFLAGRNSIRRCLKWCENHKDFLKQNMKLENGIASPATVSRILGNIDEEMFGLVLIEWMTGILSTKGINIAIDGKVLRGSMEKIKNKKTPYILNVIDTATALVIAQLPIAEKENEITAIPRLLELLNIKGSLVTIDAIGTAQPIMDAIQKKKQIIF